MKNRHRAAWPSFALLLLAATALGEDTSAADEATLKGTVKIKGPIPKRTRIRVEGDPKCGSMHRDGLWSEEVVADAAGRLQYALVYVKSGLDGKSFEAPKKPVQLEQRGCRFEPHVLGIMVGQELMIKNGDDLMHIVHVTPRSNREWGFSQARVGETRPKTFDKPELPIRLFCDVHPWMQAWAGVFEHPFHDVTDARGAFEIKGLPPGKYVIEVWHETYAATTHEVELKARETKTLAVELTERSSK